MPSSQPASRDTWTPGDVGRLAAAFRLSPVRLEDPDVQAELRAQLVRIYASVSIKRQQREHTQADARRAARSEAARQPRPKPGSAP